MSQVTSKIIEKLENQLSQAILYLGAIEALAEAHRERETLRQDPFLFSTVYEALWDALIVRIGTIWDATKGVVSLPTLAKELRRLGPAAKSVVGEIQSLPTSERARLKAWRHSVIAHSRFPFDANVFDQSHGIDVADVRIDIDRIERVLSEASKCLGRTPPYYQVLKEDALFNARASLARQQRSVA